MFLCLPALAHWQDGSTPRRETVLRLGEIDAEQPHGESPVRPLDASVAKQAYAAVLKTASLPGLRVQVPPLANLPFNRLTLRDLLLFNFPIAGQ